MTNQNITLVKPNRRDVLFGLGAGLGSVALTSLLHAEENLPHRYV
jgi:hypothetical protein